MRAHMERRKVSATLVHLVQTQSGFVMILRGVPWYSIDSGQQGDLFRRRSLARARKKGRIPTLSCSENRGLLRHRTSEVAVITCAKNWVSESRGSTNRGSACSRFERA